MRIESFRGGLHAAVFSGFAVSVVAQSALVSGMRVIGRAESFPGLPHVDLVLHRAPGPASLPRKSSPTSWQAFWYKKGRARGLRTTASQIRLICKTAIFALEVVEVVGFGLALL